MTTSLALRLAHCLPADITDLERNITVSPNLISRHEQFTGGLSPAESVPLISALATEVVS